MFKWDLIPSVSLKNPTALNRNSPTYSLKSTQKHRHADAHKAESKLNNAR